jgi:CRISPR-associated protein Csc3
MEMMMSEERETEPFFLGFLKDAIDPADSVTFEFVELVLPALMEHWVDTSAKGGTHARDTHWDEETKRKFEDKPDQSMVSHQLNGIFPTLRLLNLLESERLAPEPYTRLERRVYILAYLMHDVDKLPDVAKILRNRGLETGDRVAIESAKDMIAGQLRKCNVAAFLPDFAAYLEDITYLVVNTQMKWGTHLNTYGWRFQLKERRLFELRRLCTFSDHIAYLVPAPAAILGEEADTLRIILGQLSNYELEFTYHQLREARGLFTNVINNGMVQLYTGGRGGIWPYLFFADGVVYIKRKSVEFSLTTEQIVETVRESLRRICAGTIKNQAPGFKYDPKGLLKHPAYYFEFLSLEEYLELLVRFTIDRTNSDIVAGPLEKIQQMQADGQVWADLPTTFTTDKRASMLARFFSALFGTLLGMFEKKQEALREQVEVELVTHLGLTRYWAQAQLIPGKGGTEYRWFWLAACYLHDHQGIREHQGQGNLKEVFTSTLRLLTRLAGDVLRQAMVQRQKYLSQLTDYLESMIEVPLTVRAGGMLPDFHGEIERYASAKNRGRKEKICTLCNSAYPTEEQSDNAVLFQPFVYKNKLSLYAGSSAGGVCAICALELMLRQILQKGELRLTGSKFEAMKTKFLYIYPNFFFTAETGAMVQSIVDQLKNINFFTERKVLGSEPVSVERLIRLHAFSRLRDEPKEAVSLYDDGDEAEEDIDEGDQDGEAFPVAGKEGVQEEREVPERGQEGKDERSYIKYGMMDYPGLCFFGVRAGKDDDDTSSWAMPAFLALTLPLVTGVKVVLSETSLPLFASGHDFLETVIFDAPHPFLDRLLRGKHIRVNDLLRKLSYLTHIYEVNLDTYARQGKPEWKHLNGITRDIETDPLYLFSYLRKQARSAKRDALSVYDALRYMGIYKEMLDLEDDLGYIQHCVDHFTVFYQGYKKSHTILRPVDIVAKTIINSPLDVDREDLLWEIQGQMQSWLERVRSHQAEGRAMFWGKAITAQEMPAVREFVRYFYDEVFMTYCQGERGILRSRINAFKDGCEAYYRYWRSLQGGQEVEQEQEEDLETETVG